MSRSNTRKKLTAVTDVDIAGAKIDFAEAEELFKALASQRRLRILEWLKDPKAHFPPQAHGDPVEDGACNLFIVEKLGVSQPAGSRHLRVLVDAGLVIPTRRKGWTYYRRNEAALTRATDLMKAL
jgi:ArsR family transcriptional regulator